MSRFARTFPAAVVQLSLVALLFAGCSSTRHVPFNSAGPLDRATGVTMRSGSNISFAERGASAVNDTLFALGPRGQVKVPTKDIARVWTRTFAPGRTVGLVLGLAFATVAIATAISLDHQSFFGGY